MHGGLMSNPRRGMSDHWLSATGQLGAASRELPLPVHPLTGLSNPSSISPENY